MRTAALLLLSACALAAENSTRPSRFHVEHPTLLNLGFEWAIEGDANRNATVEVRFRKAGTEAWRPALPLLRIGGEQVYRTRESMTYTVPDGFAGSILNLEPGTSYECEFTLKDPDGVTGTAQQRATVSTRTEPKPYTGGRVLHVYPADHQGPRQEPSFIGFKAAYYGEGRGDWTAVRMTKAQPGDTILIHGGLYRPERLNYVDPLSAPFTGSWSLSLKGTAEKPITIKAAGDGEAIFDGAGNHKLFDVMATHHHIFEGLTFRNTEVAIFAGDKDVMGAVALTIRNCRFEDVGAGVWTESAESRDFFISDNLFLGREDQMRLIGWNQAGSRAAGIYPSHQLRSFFAVKVYGPGHIIAHNSVAYFHDGICISTYGPPDPDPERRASSIDIYNNDIHLSNDDFVESDGGTHNIRIFQNRGVNAAHNGYSAQPMFGGPVYFFRNVLYHVPAGGAFKFGAKPAGILVYHNTLIGEQTARDPYSNAHYRNNLFLGRDTPNRGVMTWANATAQYSSDYNGYRPNRNVKAQYTWLAPAAGKAVYEPKDGDWRDFATLGELQKAAGQEAHGIEVDYDIFESLTPPDPARRYHVYHAMDLNFRLKPNAKAVDAGSALPTVNDNFSGKAPDLGALEAGQPEPHLRSPLAHMEAILPIALVAAMVLLVSLAAWFDIRERRIPNALTAAGMVAGLGLNTFERGLAGLSLSLKGLAVAFAIYFALYLLRAMGAGDVKLMAALGSLAGPVIWLSLFLVVSITGALCALLVIGFSRRWVVTWGNVKFALSELAQLRLPATGRSELDVRSGEGVSLPHAVPIALGTYIYLVFSALR